MRQTILLALAVMLAATGIVFALLRLAAETREVSGQLAALSRNVNSIGGDITSLADDVNAIADAIAPDDDDDKDEKPARVTAPSRDALPARRTNVRRRVTAGRMVVRATPTLFAALATRPLGRGATQHARHVSRQ